MSYQTILKTRGLGIMRCSELYGLEASDPLEILKRCGLEGSWNDLREVKKATAQEILKLFLWKDAAYLAELMPLAEAKAHMLSLPIWSAGFKYFTNGGWVSHYEGAASWIAFTDAPFDGGIIAVSDGLVACYWFEDAQG